MEDSIIREEPQASNGWNNGDLDVCKQLFSCGMVWDGNLVSKDSRDHLVRNGFAVRHDGMQSLTGKGTYAYLEFMIKYNLKWWTIDDLMKHIKNELIASPETIKRAMD
jgi:hypothetical protein